VTALPPGESAIRALSRAVAHRGQLHPVWRELSDRMTLSMQRLYPVWVLLGPGLSAPGHIDLKSRTVFLDSDELLATIEDVTGGRLDRRRVLATFGVSIHETWHAKHTKIWVKEYDAALDDDQLRADRELLEEPRMEAHGARDHQPASRRGKFVRAAVKAAVTDVIMPRFQMQLAVEELVFGEPTRELCGQSAVYMLARTLYGTFDRAELAPLELLWRKVLGDDDLRRLEALFADLIWIPDGDNRLLDDAARLYRDIIGPPPARAGGDDDGDDQADGGDQGAGRADDGEDQADGGGQGAGDAGDGEDQADGGGQGAGDAGDGDDRADNGSGGAGDGRPGRGPSGRSVGETLRDVLDDVLRGARTSQLRQFNEVVDLEQLLQDPASAARPIGAGGGTGAPTGRLPDRGVDRGPYPDEVAVSRRFGTRLLRARTFAQKRIDKRTPGGHFNSRSYMRGRAQRASRRPVSARPWEIRRDVHAPIEEPHVALVVDTSGSMGGYEYALGPVAWELQTGMHRAGGRMPIGLFGNGSALLCDGSEAMTQVPGIRTGGGTAFAGDTIEMVTDLLDIANPRRPRALYILSDGGWYDTEAGVARIRALAELGVPTIHIALGIEPLSVEASRVCVIDDPADALDVIAEDTVAALEAQARRRHPQRT